MNDFTNNVAVITGAASGIGRNLAIELAQRGCILELADLNMTGLIETQKLLAPYQVRCRVHQLDVANQQQFEALAKDVFEQHGQVNMLFNNAGVTLIDTVENQSLENFHWLMNINFWGVVHGCRAFLPYLTLAKQSYIVNVSSLFGLLSMPLQSAYNASKFAVRGYTESLRTEMKGSNVSVSCVHPGGIKTAIASNAKVSANASTISKDQMLADFEKAARTSAYEAARIIIRGMENQQRRILVGSDAKVMDFIVRVFPALYSKIFGFEKNVIAKRKARLAK